MLTVGFAAEAEALRKRAELSDAMLLRKEPLTAEELEPLCIEKCADALALSSQLRQARSPWLRDRSPMLYIAAQPVCSACADALGCVSTVVQRSEGVL